MSVQIIGTTVIDTSRNLVNIEGANVSGVVTATSLVASSGANVTGVVTATSVESTSVVTNNYEGNFALDSYLFN